MISAVPTTYKGQRFRSTLEADWAATFDHLGWYWEYEPVALHLGGKVCYRPDFHLPGQHAWVEVKGPHNEGIDKTRRTMRSLATNPTGRADLVVVARPAGPANHATWHSADGSHHTHITRCAACQQWCFHRPLADHRKCRHCNCDALIAEATYIGAVEARSLRDLFADTDPNTDWTQFWYAPFGRLTMQRARPAGQP